MREPKTLSYVECLHRRTRRAIVRTPMGVFEDCVCRDCRRVVRWPEKLQERWAALTTELAGLEAEMRARGVTS